MAPAPKADTAPELSMEEMDASFAQLIEQGVFRSGVHSNGLRWDLRILPQGQEYALFCYIVRDTPVFALSTEGQALLDEQINKMAKAWPASCTHLYGEVGFIGLALRTDALTLLGLLNYTFEKYALVFGRASTGIQHARPRLNPWSPSGMPVREPE